MIYVYIYIIYIYIYVIYILHMYIYDFRVVLDSLTTLTENLKMYNYMKLRSMVELNLSISKRKVNSNIIEWSYVQLKAYCLL